MSQANIILPAALCIGPERTGTTWTHEYFEHRGDICLPAGAVLRQTRQKSTPGTQSQGRKMAI